MWNYSRWTVQNHIGDPLGLDKIIQISDNLLNCLDANSNEMVRALHASSKSSNLLAKVGIFVWIVGAIATIIGTYYWYLAYLK